MSRKVESLKRLYKNNRISKERLEQLLEQGEITQEEFDYIITPVENGGGEL